MMVRYRVSSRGVSAAEEEEEEEEAAAAAAAASRAARSFGSAVGSNSSGSWVVSSKEQ